MNKSTSIDEGRAGFCSFTAYVDPAAAGDQHPAAARPLRIGALGEEVGSVTIVEGPIMAA
jgi:hypothetical protein